jgi:hypothetical protein
MKSLPIFHFFDIFFEKFVLGFLLLLLSPDKGTAGQGNFFCLGTKGQQDVPFLETLLFKGQ